MGVVGVVGGGRWVVVMVGTGWWGSSRQPPLPAAGQPASQPASQKVRKSTNSYFFVFRTKKYERLQMPLKAKSTKKYETRKVRIRTFLYEFSAAGRMAGWLAGPAQQPKIRTKKARIRTFWVAGCWPACIGGWLRSCEGEGSAHRSPV